MENIEADINFGGAEIDPNQLGFPTVTESGFTLGSSAQSVANGNIDVEDHNSSNSHPGQATSASHMYPETLSLNEYSNIAMNLETELSHANAAGLQTFLSLQHVAGFPGVSMQAVEQMSTVASPENVQQQPQHQENQEDQMNMTQSLELSSAVLSHLCSSTNSRSGNHPDLGKHTLSAPPLASTQVYATTASALNSLAQVPYAVPSRAGSSFAEVSASFLQSLQNQRASQLNLALGHPSYLTQQALAENTLPSVSGMLPTKTATSPTDEAKASSQSSPDNVSSYSQHLPAEVNPYHSQDTHSLDDVEQEDQRNYTEPNLTQNSLDYIYTSGAYAASLGQPQIDSRPVNHATQQLISTLSSNHATSGGSAAANNSSADSISNPNSGLSQLLNSILATQMTREASLAPSTSVREPNLGAYQPMPNSASVVQQPNEESENSQHGLVLHGSDVEKLAGRGSYVGSSQTSSAAVVISEPSVIQPSAFVQAQQSHAASDSQNEPEMMIFHDKMTRKNILVPIGPPNVTAGRGMPAPNALFLDGNASRVNNTGKITSNAAEATSSDSSGINVSDYLNPPQRTPLTVSTSIMNSKLSRSLDSPPDDMVSSTTQDVRKDLPPLHEILSPQHHFTNQFASVRIPNEQLLKSHAASSSDSLADYNMQGISSSRDVSSGLGRSSFHHNRVSSAGDIQYEPISDSEEGEISTTCPVTPLGSRAVDYGGASEVEDIEDDDDDEDYEETEDDDVVSSGQEDQKVTSHYSNLRNVALKGFADSAPQNAMLAYSGHPTIVVQPSREINQGQTNVIQETAQLNAIATNVIQPQGQLNAVVSNHIPASSQLNTVQTSTIQAPSQLLTQEQIQSTVAESDSAQIRGAMSGYTMPFKKVEVQYLQSGQTTRQRPTLSDASAVPDQSNLAASEAGNVTYNRSFDQSPLKCGMNLMATSENAVTPCNSEVSRDALSEALGSQPARNDLEQERMLVNQALVEVGTTLNESGTGAQAVPGEMVEGMPGDEAARSMVSLQSVLLRPMEANEEEKQDEEEDEEESTDVLLSKGAFKQKVELNIKIEQTQCVVLDGQKKWVCQLCPKSYSSKHNLVTHILGHNGIKPHCCVICGKFFKQLSHLHTHLLTHRKSKPHVCKICDRGFTQASHAKRHMAVHMERRPHICTVCERGFVYPSELKIHMEKHNQGKENVCADCGHSFPSTKKLKVHMQVAHKDLAALSCKQCGKSFSYPSQLRDHMLKHDGKRTFLCGECGVDFMKEHHLRAHQFTHTGLRPYVCRVCGRAFNQKANMQRHMVVHESERKYACNVCQRTFTQAQVLRSHMVTHADHKPHRCQICNKEFSRLHNLNGHMHIHSGNKPHVCFCGSAFTLKSNLNRHKKDKHGISVTGDSERTTEEEAAYILNEMSSRKMLQDSAPEDSLDGNSTDIPALKKKRKSVPRKSVKEETHQSVEEDIGDVWRVGATQPADDDDDYDDDDEDDDDDDSDDGLTKERRDNQDSDQSNMEFISRFMNLTGMDKSKPGGNLITDNMTPNACKATPSQAQNTVTAPQKTPVNTRTKSTLNTTPCVSRSGRRFKKVSYLEEGGSQSDEDTPLDTDPASLATPISDNDPDWGTVSAGGGKGVKGRRKRGKGEYKLTQASQHLTTLHS